MYVILVCVKPNGNVHPATKPSALHWGSKNAQAKYSCQRKSMIAVNTSAMAVEIGLSKKTIIVQYKPMKRTRRIIDPSTTTTSKAVWIRLTLRRTTYACVLSFYMRKKIVILGYSTM